METIEEPIVETRLLIYENLSEIGRISQEAQTRASLLNSILACGLTPTQIKEVAVSERAISEYVFSEQLKVNKALAIQHAAGKRNLIDEYALPQNLEHMKRQLLTWFQYPMHRGADRYQFLKFIEGKIELDNHGLEKEFTARKLKFYIAGEQLNEYREIDVICKFFETHQMPSNQIKDSSFLWNRIEPVGMYQYKPRWTWFMRER